MDMRNKILLKQMNKAFDNGEANQIRNVFVTFIASTILGFLLTLLIAPATHQKVRGHNTNDVDFYLQEASLNHKEQSTYDHLSRHNHSNQNTEVAERLSKAIRILCLVTTHKDHLNRAKRINETWGSRCNHVIFVSPTKLDSFETLVVPEAKEGKDFVWHSVREGLKYVHEQYADKFDYVIKTDDNTYVLVENLRYLLETESPKEPKAYGFKYKEQGVVYLANEQILSREAVRLFAEKAYTDESLCKTGKFGNYDLELGKCLQNVGVKFGETFDSEEKERVFPFSPMHHMLPETMTPGKNKSYVAKAVRRKDGLGSLSDHAVSFHSLVDHSQVLFDYLIYHLRPYGIVYKYTETDSS